MARTEDPVSSAPVTPDELVPAGRGLAAIQDATLEARDRPPLDTRLASLRRARARRSPPGDGVDRGGRLALAGGVTALAAAAAWALWVRSTAPIEFAIGPDHAPAEVGAWLAAAPTAPLPVAFSDGSRIDLAPGARARVVEVTEDGARVVLERGSADVAVVHREATRWAIVSGPFEVRVVGTRFEAAWDPAEEALTVHLAEGEVAIAGACLAAPHTLRRGESVRLSCRDVVAPADGHVRSEPSGAATPPAPPFPSASSSAAAAPSPPAPAGPGSPPPPVGPDPAGTAQVEEPEPASPSWRDLAREGRGKEAWAAAEGEGLDQLLATLPAADLLQLADLARLAGRGSEARRVYGVVRDRFAGSDAAAAAAFHLGRMSFDGSGAYAQAARWFSTYLAERPGGAFAPEATGRLMESLERSGDRAGAQRLAAHYLERWPRGAHAALAASLVTP